jgi:ferredoxin
MRLLSTVAQSKAPAFLDGNTAKGFIVNEKCNHCGMCAKVCPVGNITVTDKPVFSDKCEVCLGCVHNCPNGALHLKNEKSELRFRNPDVTLKEIIEANCQQ